MTKFEFNPAVLPYLAKGGGGVAQGLEIKAKRVESAAKDNAPVGTGALRDSIKVSVGEDAGRIAFRVGTSLAYARFQEFGTVYVEPDHFLTEAIEDA